jgi:hypothetical protein
MIDEGGVGSVEQPLTTVSTAVGDQAEVLLDGGVRRRSDVVKAVALVGACRTWSDPGRCHAADDDLSRLPLCMTVHDVEHSAELHNGLRLPDSRLHHDASDLASPV